MVSEKARRITGDKHLTKLILKEYGVNVPEGELFEEEVPNEYIVDYANKLKYPVVVKPFNGYQGIGVFANIQNEEEFKEALIHLREEMGYKKVIVEKFIDGVEYRIFVIGDKLVGAIEKIPPCVYGDGKRTIKELIENKNTTKKSNPHLYKKPIKIDYEVKKCLENAGYNLDDVLENEKALFLREKSSLSSGGDPVDATDKINEETKMVSIKSVNAIKDLVHTGIDVMVDKNTQKPYVIEINAVPMIGSHLFPEIGVARDVPSAIIDYYFPETKNNPRINDNFHFDLKDILRPLIRKSANNVEVIAAPFIESNYSKRYLISGKVQGVGYRNWIRRQSLGQDLYGFARNLNNGMVEVVISGEKEKVVSFKEICARGPKRAEVLAVEEYDWNKPIKVGFEIKATQKKKRKKGIKKLPVKQPLTFKQKLKRKIKGVFK